MSNLKENEANGHVEPDMFDDMVKKQMVKKQTEDMVKKLTEIVLQSLNDDKEKNWLIKSGLPHMIG